MDIQDEACIGIVATESESQKLWNELSKLYYSIDGRDYEDDQKLDALFYLMYDLLHLAEKNNEV
jgi:hypothetical protein